MVFGLASCSASSDTKNVSHQQNKEQGIVPDYVIDESEDYKLILPSHPTSLLVLFPCFPCGIDNTLIEFDIKQETVDNNIAVLALAFNKRLWLTLEEKTEMEQLLLTVAKKKKLNLDNVVFGGFSSGGNVSLLMSDYLKSIKSPIAPNGTFIVDSPIDLFQLYHSSIKNIEKNFSKPSVDESTWIVDTFESEFGKADSNFVHFENASPFMTASSELKNASNLKDVKLRFYSEPDTTWWWENRHTKYEDMNAFSIEKFSIKLKKIYGTANVEYITTENKGYRKNGTHHPHSWSIVNQTDLIKWIKEME